MLTLQKIAADLEISPDNILNFRNIKSLDNPQKEEFLSIISSQLHQKNVDELKFILQFLHNFSEFIENSGTK